MNSGYEEFGPWLKSLRDEHRPPLNQSELSALIGFDQTMISRVESGKLEPTGDFCIALSNAMDIPISTVLLKAGKLRIEAQDDQEESEAARKIRQLVALLDTDDRERAIRLLETLVDTRKKQVPARSTRPRPG